MSGDVQVSELLDRALQIALCGHAGQSRKGDSGLPYAVHPTHMALMLARFGADVHVQAAALVHDVPGRSPGRSARPTASPAWAACRRTRPR
jgi:(p)ppGpp synthase/HD superfamily hydrolase